MSMYVTVTVYLGCEGDHNNCLFSKTIRRKRKVQIPVSRPGDRETMSEHEEEDSDEDDGYEHHSGHGGPSAYEGASGGTGRRHDRERSNSGRRDHSASRERSVSPRSDRRSQASSAPPRPAKVTLVKSRKNEGGQHNVQAPGKLTMHIVDTSNLHKAKKVLKRDVYTHKTTNSGVSQLYCYITK